MTTEEFFWRRAVVFASALVYWAGVLVQARRVRRQIGRSPNLRPRERREKLLWAGWLLVILVWMGQPFSIRGADGWPGLRFIHSLLHPPGLVLGIVLVIAGYAGTLWCYVAMGNTWRIGINRKEKNALVTHGPYRVVRHPLYLFQIVMLAGVFLLLPTVLSAVVLILHFLCVQSKASDEESYLQTLHGESYRDYLSRTGSLFPKFWRNSAR